MLFFIVLEEYKASQRNHYYGPKKIENEVLKNKIEIDNC